MSGEIVLDIQEEIVKRLPVKPLVRFRSVCKAWKRLIDSSSFIAAHTGLDLYAKHLFVRYLVEGEARYVSIVDDDTFPHQRFVRTVPLSIKLLKESHMVGSCSGLLCSEGYYYDYPLNSRKRMVVLWNPSIRKSIAIVVPGLLHPMDQSAFGFGVCPLTNDPKIVIVPQRAPLHESSSQINDPREVMVYTLSSGKWKTISSNVMSRSIRVRYFQVIDRFMYWSGSHLVAKDNYNVWNSTLIMSFDMTNDTFKVIDLPNNLAGCYPHELLLSKRRESLVLYECKTNYYAVWMMENGVQKSFTKLFNIVTQYVPVKALGFRKSGAHIMKISMRYPYEKDEIVEYDPDSKIYNVVEIGGIKKSISTVNSYVGTLLLLGRSDCTSY